MNKPAKGPKVPQPPVTYYENLLLAFVRGHTSTPVETVDEALDMALLSDLKVDKFKRKKVLPRVEAVIAHLRDLEPTTLLDVGCGRGTALWPIMETFPNLAVTGTDAYEGRGVGLRTMRDAGVGQIVDGLCLEAEALTGVANKGFDVSICLEVLEHVVDPEKAAKELVRVTNRAVVVSVPSVKDWNPDHVRLFTAGSLKNLWLRAGAKKVTVSEVPKHFVALISL